MSTAATDTPKYAVFGQWLALQIPFWLLVLFGVRLTRQPDESEVTLGPRGGQFLPQACHQGNLGLGGVA